MTALDERGGWRETILRHFTPESASASRLTIVSDPDRLLTEQSVLDGVRQGGFDLIGFEDSVAFRFAYESRYRQRWDHGTSTPLVVVLRSEREDVDTLPYDLLRTASRYGRILRFGLPQIFPSLAPAVVQQLDRSDFDGVHEAVGRERPGNLGENATKDFLLREVYGVVPELITSPVDLLRLLLRRHFRNQQLPPVLDERLVERLEGMKRFPGWPLQAIIPNRLAFFAFLEERWPAFVRSHVDASGKVGESKPPYRLTIDGPMDIPFGHDDIRVFIDNLFVEGHLAPTDAVAREAVNGTWLACGVRGDPVADDRERFAKLTDSLAAELPSSQAAFQDWIGFGRRWAEWSALRSDVVSDDETNRKAEVLWTAVDDRFTAWMGAHFPTLHNVAYLPQPVMVHHVARYMAHGWQGRSAGRRLALLVVDGLAWSQWVPLRMAILEATTASLSMRETGVFAWVPTITPVSRQAIFAAEPPLYFAQSIRTTAKDEHHWRRFWQDRGLHGSAVQFVGAASQEVESDFLSRLLTAAEHPACLILGAVVPTVDEMVHGATTGSRGLHAQVRHWAQEGHLRQAITALVDRGFTVHLTSDHGNVESIGIGKPNVGAVAGERGERVHVFEDSQVRATVQTAYPKSLEWPPVGLPEGYLPLVARGQGAFISEGKRVVGHGGISLQEVVVPFVRIERSG